MEWRARNVDCALHQRKRARMDFEIPLCTNTFETLSRENILELCIATLPHLSDELRKCSRADLVHVICNACMVECDCKVPSLDISKACWVCSVLHQLRGGHMDDMTFRIAMNNNGFLTFRPWWEKHGPVQLLRRGSIIEWLQIRCSDGDRIRIRLDYQLPICYEVVENVHPKYAAIKCAANTCSMVA